MILSKESIFRLGLNHIRNIDYNNSIEIYDQSTNDHIIKLRLLKVLF